MLRVPVMTFELEGLADDAEATPIDTSARPATASVAASLLFNPLAPASVPFIVLNLS